MKRVFEYALAAAVLLGIGFIASIPPAGRDVDWTHYGGNSEGQRYSPLDQINTGNVAALAEAWRVDGPVGGLQTTPLVIGRTLYGYDAEQRVIALEAATGEARWTFDSGTGGKQSARGLSWWQSGMKRRLFAGIMDRLYALDPDTGLPDPAFGEGGYVDLRKGLGNDYTLNATYMTSPGVVFGDLVITGFRTAETRPAAPGAVRAYDVRTGKLVWTFFTIPRPGDYGYESWPRDAWKQAGGANSWGGMVVDVKRGIVFVPTGSAVDDFYGDDRHGDNLYANSLVALDARTGKRMWHFQAVHHDLWDMDFPAPPVLLTVRSGGRLVEAVAQISKQGYVFLFERTTGKPLHPIEEQPFEQSRVPGEKTSPTQPVPLRPAPFARQRLTEDMLTRRTPEAAAYVREKFARMRSAGIYTPLASGQDTIVFPGTDGGAEWGGAAADPTRGIIYVNSNDVPWMMALAPRGKVVAPGAGVGARLYGEQCAACHGANHGGSPPAFPSLLTLRDRLRPGEVAEILAKGKGRMPAFPNVRGENRDALIGYLYAGPSAGQKREVTSKSSTVSASPYLFTGYRRFVDPDGYPAAEPPWGTLNAIDMNSGKYLWRIPLGEYPELAGAGSQPTGTENYGGPILTGGGVLFIGATIYDRKLRAFDAANGHLLWEAELPYAGNATPVTYMVDGIQYVVIAASGGKDWRGPQGSAYVAFALPERARTSKSHRQGNPL